MSGVDLERVAFPAYVPKAVVTMERVWVVYVCQTAAMYEGSNVGTFGTLLIKLLTPLSAEIARNGLTFGLVPCEQGGTSSLVMGERARRMWIVPRDFDWVGAIPVTRAACIASEPLEPLSGRIRRSSAFHTTFPLPAQEVL